MNQEDARRLAKELEGVIVDVEEGDGFDEVCLSTLKYVRDALVLAQPEQEPVIDKSAAVRIATSLGWEPKRKPLTDEEITEAIRTSNLYMKPSPHTPQSIWLALLVGYARAIEAAHGIKE